MTALTAKTALGRRERSHPVAPYLLSPEVAIRSRVTSSGYCNVMTRDLGRLSDCHQESIDLSWSGDARTADTHWRGPVST
jgi:hypothetical protein